MSGIFKYPGVRKSHQSLNEVYFWTSVIKDWKHLLKEDEMKKVILESFRWLVQHELVYIYGFVIMPNPRLTGRAGYSCTLGTIKNER